MTMPPTNKTNNGKVAANSASAWPFCCCARKRVIFKELARRAQGTRRGLEGGHDLSAERNHDRHNHDADDHTDDHAVFGEGLTLFLFSEHLLADKFPGSQGHSLV